MHYDMYDDLYIIHHLYDKSIITVKKLSKQLHHIEQTDFH